MWNEKLIARARTYPSGVLAVVEESGYPRSVRCVVEFDELRELILFPTPPPDLVGRQGLACLLFHRHDADRMPVAGSPLDIVRFMILGRRKSRAYLAKRGKPWTPRPWGKMLRYLDEP